MGHPAEKMGPRPRDWDDRIVRFKPAIIPVLGAYSVAGGFLLGGVIAAASLAVPLALQLHKTPDYAGGYEFFVLIVCVLASLYGLIAGFAQFVVVSVVALLTRSGSVRARAALIVVSGVALAVGASLVAMQVFGYQAMPWWLVPVVVALDLVGLLLVIRAFERRTQTPSRA